MRSPTCLIPMLLTIIAILAAALPLTPFQATRLDPSGKPEVVWKDTLLVPPASNVPIFTQYPDCIGQFVMHSSTAKTSG
jgi:hypothetical protein